MLNGICGSLEFDLVDKVALHWLKEGQLYDGLQRFGDYLHKILHPHCNKMQYLIL